MSKVPFKDLPFLVKAAVFVSASGMSWRLSQ